MPALTESAFSLSMQIHPALKVIPKKDEKTKKTKRINRSRITGLNGDWWVEGEAECVSSPHSARITRMLVRIKAHRNHGTHRKERCQSRY